MKKLAIFLLLSAPLFAQQVHPNIYYNALLNAACTNANTACPQAAFVTSSVGFGQNTFAPGTYSTLDVPTFNYNAATITVQGTYSGVTIAFDFSDPTGGAGNTYYQQVCARTDVNVLEPSETLPTNQTRAWNCPVWATTRFRVRVTAYGSGSVNVWIALTEAAIDPSLVVAASPPVVPGSTDSCQDLSQQKTSAFANITTATTTALVAPSGTTNIYVCSYEITSFSATTPNTVILENGTGAACATSPTALSPTMTQSAATVAPPAQPIIWRRQGPGTVFQTGTSQGLCALTTVGTTPNIAIWITYIQQ